ncbi:hypothetical protein AK830_g3862 [Neonectria ditissima]|uniref:Uncharacterized protein n=1 Tax=Neonectria ditissima TaxID=78410 RepID=A0A0P7BQ68_9HYPO|nr:hypothetical protein AK830_g3862 [Neonectria ditissima]
MASFFQPGKNDPATDACGPSRFEVYCNSALPADRRFNQLFQAVNFTFGVTAIVVPVLLFLVYLFIETRKAKKKRRKIQRRVSHRPPKESPSTVGSSVSDDSALLAFKTTKSFASIADPDREHTDRPLDFVLLPLSLAGRIISQDGESGCFIPESTSLITKSRVASFALDSLNPDALGKRQIDITANFLVDTYVENNLTGFAIRIKAGGKAKQTDILLRAMHQKKIPILLLCDHDDEALDEIALTHASGLVLENAVILRNGERRDYFKAQRLRRILGRCFEQREDRPGFFIGFLDRWEKQPHPAAIRRAVKLAEHFSSILEHGPLDPHMKLAAPLVDGPETLSGFEYLRRSETIQLQKSWVSESRKVWVPNGTAVPEFAPLPLEDLEAVIPHASELLSHYGLTPDFAAIRNEVPAIHLASDHLDLVPPRDSFWDSASGEETLSHLGCYPVTSEPLPEHHQIIVDVQDHLRELGMLHTVEGTEEQRLIKDLTPPEQGWTDDFLLHNLVEAMTSRQVRVFKGMDTGFAVQGSDAHFWGVSKTREGHDEECVDIFISQKAPSDAATVLHTWLAHNEVPRVERYEHELQLEMSRGDTQTTSPGIPLSIRTAIERGTYSEVLSLLHKLRASHTKTVIGDAIKKHCWSMLIEETTKAAWTLTCAETAIDDTRSVRDLLELRLTYYVRQRATQLPHLDNLVTLYELVSEKVQDALFFGQREILNELTIVLLHAYDPWESWTKCDYIDVNAELYSIILFTALRRAAFEEVYNESTDRCPVFVSQPDQAAVFSELWILGSQCETYFGLLPRHLGKAIYERYRAFLDERPPKISDRKNDEIMTMYFTPDASLVAKDNDEEPSKAPQKRTLYEIFASWKQLFAEGSAMSIFFLPAVVDLVLLTFVGRGLFMSAFMGFEAIDTAGYALLVSLLLTAGVTGWVGSTGNYYLAHYAYDNMVYFQVQRLSGGFILTVLVSIVGLIVFAMRYTIAIGFIFVAYVVCLSTHFNLLGIMSAMHQHGSPIASGRRVFLQNIPILLISPIITTFVNGHDLEVYIPVMYIYLFVSLYRYRQLCRGWSNWMSNIAAFSHKEIMEWYAEKLNLDTDDRPEEFEALALQAFNSSLEAFQRHTAGARSSGVYSDALVARVAKSMPFIAWLFKKTNPGNDHPDLFSTAWFTQLNEAKNAQRGLVRGLKDHNVFTLFRLARYDIGQTLALFILALMDRWVSLVWSAAGPYPSIYSDARARYGICMSLGYFCMAAMLLDSTLFKYWGLKEQISPEKLRDLEHSQKINREFEVFRHTSMLRALTDILGKLFIVYGCTTLLLWALVDSWETTVLYYLYSLGYTCAIIFQFNRCFTTDVNAYISILYYSATIGFIVGCVLHALPSTNQIVYIDVIAQNTCTVLAALGTTLWSWRDWSGYFSGRSVSVFGSREEQQLKVHVQHRYSAASVNSEGPSASTRKSLSGVKLSHGDNKPASIRVTDHLRLSIEEANDMTRNIPWAKKLVRTTEDMWVEKKIKVTIVSREDFWQAGLSDSCSFSVQRGAVLQVTVGFMGEAQLSLPTWQPLLATIITEAMFYHVARSQFSLSHGRALRAEHFLHSTTSLSKRLEFELHFERPQYLTRLSLKTEMDMMRHLCLDFDVDLKWESAPQSVRESILRRISGDPIKLTFEFTQWAAGSRIDLDTQDFHVKTALEVYQKCQERLGMAATFSAQSSLPLPPPELKPVPIDRTDKSLNFIHSFWNQAVSIPFACVKWIAFVSSGAPNIERELVYCLGKVPLRGVLLWIILAIWNICRLIKDQWVYWILIHHRPTLVYISRLAQKGARRKITKNAIIVEKPRKTITGFASVDENNMMSLTVYTGNLKEAPPPETPSLFIDRYDDKLRLSSREDSNGDVCTYQYGNQSRWPSSKVTTNKDSMTVGTYDHFGRVVEGTCTIGVEHCFVFQYHYKSVPKGNTDILRADYKLSGADSKDMLSVFWGKPMNNDVYDWVPSKNIGRIIRIIGDKTYTSEYEYLHRRDPTITTYIQEEEKGPKTVTLTVPEVFPHESNFLALPSNLSFDLDNLLIHHNTKQLRRMKQYASAKTSRLTLLNPISWLVLRSHRQYSPVPTWRLRTELWSHWLKGADTLDAVTTCWMDELILREERLLRPYWRARDSGRLDAARAALDANIHQIVAAIDIDTDVSEVSLLTIKTADLYSMGLSNDATEVTARPQDCFNDTHNRISVVFNDIGCWPVAPGGVSNCRRDLVNGHKTIRNHVLSECANDYGIPRFQIEKSVQSLKLLPLWGIDGGTANHGLIDNLLESVVDEKVANTNVQRDIVGIFIPLMMDFVKGARSKRLTRQDLIKYSNVILSMAQYYEQKDYTYTWQSTQLENAWVAAWLTHYDDPNIANPTDCLELERPSINDFRVALGIFRAYFFIFAVKIPDECPLVFQSTHHGISSLFGLVLKYRRGANFGIWDHAILWRECCLNISAAQCELPLSVQSMLLASIGLATRLAYFTADVITPCASLFNPTWEIEIGTDKGVVNNRNLFERKIDPIVNGISNMELFNPVEKIRTDKPTVIMLSNVQVIKGVKAAIQAAEIIINRFKFTDYQLIVYGAKDRQPAYALEMEKFIVDNNLSGKVILAGFGNPTNILKDAWLFMNSSISEGLPLAIGEAALAGVPIVATEVGATALVLTDPNNPDQRYGEVVPPNDPLALARAQISILSMVGPWTKFTDEAEQKEGEAKVDLPVLPDEITPSDVEWLTKRFYAKAEYRRKLGMLSRAVVLHSFHGTRYLREHEQMFWVQWHQSKMKKDKAMQAQAQNRFKFGTPAPLRYSEGDKQQKDGDSTDNDLMHPTMLEQWQQPNRNSMRKSLSRKSRIYKKQRPWTMSFA